MTIPDSKVGMIDEANTQVKEVQKQYAQGVVTDGERYNKVIDIWSRKVCTILPPSMIAFIIKPFSVPQSSSFTTKSCATSTKDSDKINKMGVESIKARSTITCDARYGVCASCYGNDMVIAYSANQIACRMNCSVLVTLS
jgi:hypothetical protein